MTMTTRQAVIERMRECSREARHGHDARYHERKLRHLFEELDMLGYFDHTSSPIERMRELGYFEPQDQS
jgi:hypothetical protein